MATDIDRLARGDLLCRLSTDGSGRGDFSGNHSSIFVRESRAMIHRLSDPGPGTGARSLYERMGPRIAGWSVHSWYVRNSAVHGLPIATSACRSSQSKITDAAVTNGC